jgi:branched-chain amino acid transport system substrate-binding protein
MIPSAAGAGVAGGTRTTTAPDPLSRGAVPGASSASASEGAQNGRIANPTPASAGCTGTKSEIAIGTVGGQSGIIGAATRAGADAVKAWVADINSRGGLNCHPVRYYVADDGGDPAKNAALTQQMVTDRKVIAMVFSNNPLSAQGGRPVLERAHVPTIGSEGADEYFNTSPDFFPVSPTGTKLFRGAYGMLAQKMTPDQKAHFAILTCLEASVCSSFSSPAGLEIAKQYGMNVVYNASSTMVQPDYTSNCQSAKNAGAKAMFIGADSGMTSRVIRSCSRIGLTMQYAAAPIAMAASVAELPEMDGVLLPATTLPWTVDHPVAQRYLATLAKYLPGALPQASGAIGWASALMLERAAANLPDSPTPADIYAGLWKVKNVDFDGYTVPLTYAKGKPASYPVCWWTMQIVSKQWTSPDNGRRGCAT